MKNDMINYFLVETESEQFLNYPKRDKKKPNKGRSILPENSASNNIYHWWINPANSSFWRKPNFPLKIISTDLLLHYYLHEWQTIKFFQHRRLDLWIRNWQNILVVKTELRLQKTLQERKKKNQAILRKLLIETLNNMKKKLKFICISKQKNDQNSRKQSRCDRIIHMSRK